MKRLDDILKGVEITDKSGPSNPLINSLCFDSRKCMKGSAFFALPGTETDGHRFITHAVEAGAQAVICEEIPGEKSGHITFVRVKDSAEALGLAAAAFHNHPADKLKLIGVTGTNGKTTVATLLHRLFSEAGFKCGLVSTVKYLVGKTETMATHTTPDPLMLNQLLDEMFEEGCKYCFMEVSSHAIHQRRIAGLRFSGGIFTNITHDHLDYHGTFAEYLKAKKAFFDALPAGAFALVNRDDRNSSVIVQNTKAGISRYGLRGPADFKGKVLESHLDGMQMMIGEQEIWTRLIGRFNASNILAVCGCAMLNGLDREMVLTILSRQNAVRGRFETLKSSQGILGIVDYAHTPDALKNVLETINDVMDGKSRLITVVGAGGSRDRAKRPKMGRVASKLSHKLILTSDNPREEDPEEIIRQVAKGIPAEKQKSALLISDRREAIKTAVMLAKQGDIILVAGKGHETYQEIKGKHYHFDDLEILKEYFKTN